MSNRLLYPMVLLILGLGWGLTVPLSKIAVAPGYGGFGLIFWEEILIIAMLTLWSLWFRRTLPLGPRYLLVYLVIAFTGSIIPSAVLWPVAYVVPGGVLALITALVPIFALPIALMMRLEGFSAPRAVGVLCGALAIVLIVAPETGLPDRAMVPWVLLGAVAPFMYALEANLVDKYGTLDLGADQVILGASIVSLLIVGPIAVATGEMYDITENWSAPQYALIASAFIHAVVYALYLWLVGKAGSVFASQTSYLVTASGVVWSMLILAEIYSGWFWAALAVLMAGLFLVRPTDEASLAETGLGGDNGATP
jgi:drug/metabolite transporter (DMT)-like permease